MTSQKSCEADSKTLVFSSTVDDAHSATTTAVDLSVDIPQQDKILSHQFTSTLIPG